MAEETSIKPRTNFISMIAAAVAAIIIWVAIVVAAFPNVSVTLREVGIDFSLEGSYAEVAGLSIINADANSVNIKFSGLRYQIGDYDASDIHVGLDLSSVRASGTLEIPLIVTTHDGSRIEIEEMEPQTVHIEFDRLATKTLSFDDGSLRLDQSNIRTVSGYLLDPDEITITPSEIVISGPQDYINQVDSCVVSFDTSLLLNESLNSSTSNIVLYSGDTEFKNSKVTQNVESFDIYLPVYRTKELPLTVAITSYNDHINTDSIGYTLSKDSVLVRSQNRAIEEIEEIQVGYIDLREVMPGSVFNYTIPQNSVYTNISGVDTVQVTFDLEGYTTKNITLSNSRFYTINTPAGYEVKVLPDIMRVSAVGPADILNDLDSTNFVAEIDMIEYISDPFEDERYVTVSVYAPNYPDVWVYGVYTVPVSMVETVPQDTLDAGSENSDQ